MQHNHNSLWSAGWVGAAVLAGISVLGLAFNAGQLSQRTDTLTANQATISAQVSSMQQTWQATNLTTSQQLTKIQQTLADMQAQQSVSMDRGHR